MERLKNIPVSARVDLQLKDLGEWDRLEAICVRCRHRTVLRPTGLRRRWEGTTPIVTLEEKLRCKGCGNRVGNRLGLRRVRRD